MKIMDVRQTTVPIRSDMKNAVISFSEMTVSLVAVISDVVRDGHSLVGYGFNSNGRYAQPGILEARMIPRLLAAKPDATSSEDGRGIDPRKAWDIMMRNEKPGGHGDRSVAVAVLDMAIWDLAAKIENKPLYQLIAERYGSQLGLFGGDEGPKPEVAVYAAGGYYDANKGIEGLKEEMRGYLENGYTTLKMKIGGAPLAQDMNRIEAVLSLLPGGAYLAVDANGRFDLETAIAYSEALSQFGLQMAAGFHLYGNESYPGVFRPFGGFADGVGVENGTVRIPDAPGIGIELKSELYRLCRDLVQ